MFDPSGEGRHSDSELLAIERDRALWSASAEAGPHETISRLSIENAYLWACVDEVDKVLKDGPCFCEDEHGIRCAFCSLWDAYDEKRAKLENKP